MVNKNHVTKNNKKVAVITGCSSGIGFETSLLLARNGFYTYATMRNPEESKKEILAVAKREKLFLQVIPLDVTDARSVKDAIKKIIKEQKRIDILVNNAGYLLLGSLEELSITEVAEQFETNFFGVIRVTQAVLPIMRKQRQGTIVNISSIAGRMGFPVSSAYVSSKFALEGLSESISYELEQFGIKVILIEPGITKTNFGNNFKIGKRVARNYVRHSSANSAYTKMTQNRIASFKPRFESGSPALEVADIILKSIMTNNPDLRYLVGNDALKIIDIREKIPNKDFRKLVMDSVIYHRKKK